MNLEDALREALRREDAPVGFEARVMNRVRERRQRGMARAWMAIAAMLVIGALLFGKYETQRQETARRAGQELVLALKVTERTLHSTRRMIRRRTNGA